MSGVAATPPIPPQTVPSQVGASPVAGSAAQARPAVQAPASPQREEGPTSFLGQMMNGLRSIGEKFESLKSWLDNSPFASFLNPIFQFFTGGNSMFRSGVEAARQGEEDANSRARLARGVVANNPDPVAGTVPSAPSASTAFNGAASGASTPPPVPSPAAQPDVRVASVPTATAQF